MKLSYSRINIYEEWIPQFADGSGWNRNLPDIPYFYQELTKKQSAEAKKSGKGILYKVTCLIEDPKFHPPEKIPDHLNTYFVKGKDLEPFLRGFYREEPGLGTHNPYDEKIIKIEIVDKIPSMKWKLKEYSESVASEQLNENVRGIKQTLAELKNRKY